MSLTSILKCPTYQDLRSKLKDEFPKPKINSGFKINAIPASKNYGVIGTAFDYLVRFYLEANNNGGKIYKAEMICHHAFRSLIKKLEKQENLYLAYQKTERGVFEIPIDDLSKKQSEFYKLIGYTIIKKDEFIANLHKQFRDYDENYKAYLANRKLTTKLIRSAIFIAKLDIYFRAGIFEYDIATVAEEDIMDLRTLYQIFRKQDFCYEKRCFLNPTFGKGSMIVGGADADIIIDDTLIDIKVTKNLELERSMFNQLICYYFLSVIGGINTNSKLKPIKKVGIYFARHGYLWLMPVSELGTPDKIEAFTHWLCNYLEQRRAEDLQTINEQLKKLQKQMVKKTKKQSVKQGK